MSDFAQLQPGERLHCAHSVQWPTVANALVRASAFEVPPRLVSPRMTARNGQNIQNLSSAGIKTHNPFPGYQFDNT